jgi:hypothetical protein
LHQVGDLFELNVKFRCQIIKLRIMLVWTVVCVSNYVTVCLR